MFNISYFCLVSLILFHARVQAGEINVGAAFSVLSDRIGHLETDARELKAIVEKNLATFNAQINDIAEEFNDMSEGMNVILSEFAETNNDDMNETRGVMEYIKSLVQKEFSADKQALREFVDRYERELENIGRYVSDHISIKNDTEEQEGISDTIPLSDNSINTCKMCMLVATTTEKKSRRLEQMLTDLTKETLEKAQEFEDLQSDVGNTMDKVLEFENNEDYQAEGLKNITNDVDALRTFVDSLSEKYERKVGFTARLTRIRNFYPGNVILVFDEVKYNYGEAYDPLTGIFKAPQSGTYLLSFNVQSTEQYDAHVCLIVGGTLRLTVVAGKGHRITGGNTGVVYMEKGEEAWVRTTTLKPRYGIWPHRTTFSGVLLD